MGSACSTSHMAGLHWSRQLVTSGEYKIPSLGMTSAPHVMLHSAAACAATCSRSQAIGLCPMANQLSVRLLAVA